MQKIKSCLFADDVLYDVERNVWVRYEGSLAVIGVNTILGWLAGPLTSVTFKPVGTVVEKGISLGAVQGPRHFDTIRSPISGKLMEVNLGLREDPRLVNRDPYGKGWFAKLAPMKPEDKHDLLPVSEARQGLERRIRELRVTCFAALPDYDMFEIGSECAGVLVKLDDLMSRSPKGTVVHLVSDDVTAEIELIAWSDRTHNEILETRREGNLFHFIIEKKH